MVSIVKYGQEIDLSKVVALNGKKSLTLDNLVLNNTIKIKIPAGIKYVSSLEENDLKIEFKDEEGNILELILKDMSTLLAQNDGFTLVELIEVLADGSEKTVGSIIDIASALQASAAGPAAGANAQSDSGATPDSLDDLLSNQNNINNAVINNARLDRATPDAEDAGNSFITQNNVPTIELIEAQTTDEDNSITISYNAVDPDGDTLIPSVTATNGTAVIDTNGDIVFTPNENFNGTAQVTLSVNDGTATTSQTFDVIVNPVNDAPTIEPILTQTVDEDGSKTITFSANDIDGDILTSSVTATNGTAVIDSNGDIVFTPEENFNGTVEVTLSVNDGTVTTSQSFNVIVNSTNDQPVVENIDINNIVTTTTPVVDEEISEFARHTTVNGEVFLGGEFIELGIHNSGSFGTSGSKPAGFYGTDDDSRLGMTSDADGFNQGEDLAIDYFLPGSPEEAWNIGYKIDDVATIATNAGLEGSYEISNFVNTDTSVGNTLSSHGTGSLNDTLQTDIDVSFGATSDYYVTTVTLTNISTTSIDDVRYMRSFDPDNTVYAGGDYTTVNTIEKTFEAGDGSALVSAVSLPDAYSSLSGDTAKIFFYSEDPTAKVTSTGFDLRDVYASDVYDNTLAKGDSITSDTAISIAFDVGTLAAGESTTVVYYTSLTNREISTVVDEIKVSGLDVYEGYLPVATDTLPTVDAEFTETNLLTGLLSVEDADIDDLGLHTFHIEKDSSGENIITIEQTPTNEDGNDILLPSDVIVDTVKNADGTWNYTINGDFSALAWDEEATISFKYYADDTRGFDGSDPLNESSISELKTITFVVKGTNGLPIVEEITIDTVLETNGIKTIYEGNLIVQDEDVNDSHIFIISTPINSTVSLNSLTLTIIDAQAGLYKVEGDFDKLSADEIATLTFGYKAIDSSNSTIGESKESAEQIVTLTVKGTNDAAIVSSESVELIETNDILTTSGLLTSTDVDNMDNSFTANTIVGSTGTFTINELGAWTYSANSAFDELNETQNVNETFEVTSIDGTASFVKIQINGTNDAPIVLSETIADPINEATLNTADITLLESVVVDITAKDFSFDITNATIVSLFDTLNIESQIKSAISLALDNMPLEDIDFSITKTDGKITIDASVPDYDGVTPLSTIITQENLNIVLLDHLGSAFNLPFENAVYSGEVNASDVDNTREDLTLSLEDVRLEVTSSNKYLLTLFEQITTASPELSLSYIQELASDLLSGDLISSSTEAKTINIPATAVTLLQTAGLLTISLDDDGKYNVISPLFNTMKETDSIQISFDYTANDGELDSNLGTTTFTIQGTNDAPVLLEEAITVETELAGTSYEGTLQGAYNLNMLKNVYDNIADARSVNDVIDIDNVLTAVKESVDINIDISALQTNLVPELSALILDKATEGKISALPDTIKTQVETVLGDLTGTDEEALENAIDTFITSVMNGTSVNDALAPFGFSILGLYDQKLTALQGDIGNAVSDTIETTTNEQTLFYAKQSFIDVFADASDLKPDLTFDASLLEDALEKYITSDKTNADEDTFKTELYASINNINETELAQLAANPALMLDPSITQESKDLFTYLSTNHPTATGLADYIESLSTAAFVDASSIGNQNLIEAEVIAAMKISIKNTIENNLGDLTGLEDLALETSVTTFVTSYIAANGDATNEGTAFFNLQKDIVKIYIANPLTVELNPILSIANAIDIDPSDIDLSGITPDTILTKVIAELGLTNIDVTTLVNPILNSTISELKTFISELSLAQLANEPEAITITFQKLLTSLKNVLDDTIDTIFTTDINGTPTPIDDALLMSTLESVVSTEITTALSTTLSSLTLQLQNAGVDAAILQALPNDINSYIVNEITKDLTFDIEAMKETALENIFTQIGLDTDLLDDDARDVIADKMVQDMYDRLGMDEDIQDIATLKYEISGTPTVIIKDENDVIQTLATETTVEIDPRYGTYTISNPDFENINTLWTAEVSFDYIVTDAESDSNTQTVNVTLDFADSTVSDGYISGALVFEDLDGDKIHDANEQSTYTDENGDFYLDTDAALVARGGTDISTGLAFTGTLTAPAGSTMLTPITTLLQNLIETSDPVLTLEEASAKVKSELGIDSSIDLITYDSYGTAKDENSSEEEKIQAQEVQEVAVQLATLMTQESSALNLLATIIEGDNDVDLTSTQTLENVLINATPEEIEAIANINTAIQSANSVELISNIQIIVEDVIEQANNGTVLDSDNIYNMADNLVPNELPTLEVIDTITVNEDSNTSITFTANDSDGTIQNVTASSANADIVVDGPQITYTPNPNYNGIDEITIIATDDDNDTVTKVITVSVTPTNDAPILEPILLQEVNEDNVKTITFTTNDIDGDVLTSSIIAVTNGEATISGNIITYTPDANYNGKALITLSVTDGLETTTQTINVTVNPVNDAPIIETIVTQTVDEDNVKTITFTATDIDIDTTLTPSVEATNGEAVINDDGNIVFTPDTNFNGIAEVTLSVTDGITSTSQTFDVIVNALNDAPTIETILTQEVAEDGSKTITFNAQDSDIDTTLTPSVTATNGEAVINDDGNIVFTPTENFNGIAEVTLSVTDGRETTTQTFNVTVTSQNDAPTIEEIETQTVDEDGNKTITFEASDIDDDKLIASANALNGEATILGNEITYIPTEDFVGTDTITLTVNDGKGGITTKDITIEVESLPVLSINSQTITESDTATFTATLSKASDVNTVFEVSIPSETSDVESTTQTLTILAGQTSVDFTIASLDDEVAEAQEEFTVQADVISGNVKNQVAQSILTLVDNDELSIYTSDIEVNEEDGTAIITVSLSTISEEQITVDYITQDSNATAGSDYKATSGTLTFEAGTTQMNITVPLTDDSIYDTNESFEVVLSNPVNAIISNNTAIVNIKDADITATITLDENVTEDNIINIEESQNNVMITGTVTQYAQAGDSVTLTVNNKEFIGSVQEGLTFAISVPGADLIADSNSTIDAQVEISDEIASFVASDSITYNVDTAIVGTPTVSILEDINNDGYISSTEISDTVNVLVEVGVNTNIGDTLTITNPDATQTDYEITADIKENGLLLEYANVEENADFSVNAQVTTASGNISEVATSIVTVDTQASNPVLIDAQNSTNSVNISISIPVGTMVGDILTVIDPLGESIDYDVTEEMINTGFTTSYSYDSLTHGDTYEVSSFTTDSAGNVSETTAHSFLVNNAPVIQDVNFDLNAQSHDVTFQGNLPGSELSVLFNSEDNFNRLDLLKNVETDLISKVTVTPDVSMLSTSNILASTQIAFGISNEDIISNIIVDKISTDVNMIAALNNLNLNSFSSINAVTLLSVSIMTETLGIDSSNNSTLNTELIDMIYSNTEFRTALGVIQANTELSSEEKLAQAKSLLVVEITPFFNDVLANPEFNIDQETVVAENIPTNISSATSDLVSSISDASNHQFFDGWENGYGDFIGSTNIPFSTIPNDSLIDSYKATMQSVLENISTEDLLTNSSVVEAAFKNALDTNMNSFISSINDLEIDQEALTSSLIEYIIMDIKYNLGEELTEYRAELETLFGPLDDNVFDSYINQMITSTLTDSIILDVQDVKDSLIENILDASSIDSNLINEEARAELASIYTQSLIERALIDSDSDDISYIFNDEVSIVTTIIDSEGNESILEGTNVIVNSDGSYTISNASLDDPELAGFDVRVTFDYLVEDSDGGLSELKTVTVEIDREDLIDNTPYLNTEISEATIDGNRTLVIDSNIGETSILDSVKIFVDGANEDSTLEFGDSVVEVQVATQPENVNITEDGFVITSGDIDNSFVMPTLSNNTTFYSFSNDGDDESQEFYVEEINFDNTQLNLTYKDLGGETELIEGIELSDEDSDGKIEVSANWGTDELTFLDAKQVTNINGTDVSALGISQVTVMMEILEQGNVEDADDWWDASWYDVMTISELFSILGDSRSVNTEKGSYSLNIDPSSDIPSGTIRNSTTNESVAGNWQITAAGMLIITIDGEGIVAFKEEDESIVMTEIAAVGTIEENTWYYGDSLSLLAMEALVSNGITSLETFDYPEYIENAPSEYYFNIEGSDKIAEVLENDITITNVDDEVNAITKIDTNLFFDFDLPNSTETYTSATGDTTLNLTDEDDTFTLQDSTASFIDAEEGEDTLDLTQEDSNLDMSTLLQNISLYNIENIDMTSDSAHILSNFTLDEFISLTDEDNTLKILGDDADSIQLDAEQQWEQHIVDGVPYKEDGDFNVYFAYSEKEDQTLKLLIEDNITVENV